MSEQFIIADESAMLDLAASLAPHLLAVQVVYLIGPLGVGKTTFARGLLQHLGAASVVKSPTYTLVESYHNQGRDIHHFDLYRLTSPEELEDIGIQDYFTADSWCLIEWPENGGYILPAPEIEIVTRFGQENHRVVRVNDCL